MTAGSESIQRPGREAAGELGESDALAALDEQDFDTIERLSRALQAPGGSLAETLDSIVSAVVATVPGADFAGINLMHGDRFEPQAVLGEAPIELDALQKRTGVGPCIDASREQRVTRIDDIDDAPSWPQYAQLAESLGIRTMLCVPLWVGQRRLGSISLYSRSPEPFGVQAERTAALLATQAAVVLAGAQRAEQLAVALHNRDLIGQAKGILMERHRITADAAFGLLAAASQRSNRKLVAVAQEIADTGVLTG